jgi:hypothetical protein
MRGAHPSFDVNAIRPRLTSLRGKELIHPGANSTTGRI